MKLQQREHRRWFRQRPLPALLLLLCAAVLLSVGIGSLIALPAASGYSPSPDSGKAVAATPAPVAPQDQAAPTISRGESAEEAAARSAGCLSCHGSIENPSMHPEATVVLGCTDCHGGDASVRGADMHDEAAIRRAHVQPRFAEDAARGGHPPEVYTRWLRESSAFVRFVNPGDLRVAEKTCGTSGCHTAEVRNVHTSMMSHGAMLWEAALYNNGAYPYKDAQFGEAYTEDGKPQRLRTWPPPSKEETRTRGVLPFLDPLPRWEVSEPGNVLRPFERGGGKRGEPGIPNPDEQPGNPDTKLSDRGLGTELRTDPVVLGLQKTRLLDPLLHLPGTNEQPGDYRASGCSGCHVVYANDRDPQHSAGYASAGNMGRSQSADASIPHDESGHPLHHVFTRAIPSSSCMVCHVHPGTNMLTTYYGYTWWDNEADGKAMYPAQQHNPSPEEQQKTYLRDPEGSTPRGNWRDLEFLTKTGTPEFNAQLKDTQFGDFHSHGWVFRKVYKRNREGNLLDKYGTLIPDSDPDALGKAVHLADIHLEKGMQCVDCHFLQDAHGNGKLYGETRNAISIDCVDCHGSIYARAALKTTGPAAADDASSNMLRMRTPWQLSRFYWRDGKLFQRSSVTEGKEWEIVQTLDTITPGNEHYSEKSRLAKTLLKDGVTWGHVEDMGKLAHADSRMTCYSCHSSWTTSCFGCHLSMAANRKMPMLHNEGIETRNYTNYNFMVLRDDVYMLGIDGTVTGNKVAPARSACAVVVSSQNANRNWIYQTQQTVSAPGFSGQAFSTYVPHTVRATETRQCTDCHVSSAGDNNAWMAQLLVQGTNFLNFMGKYIYVAQGAKGFSAIAVAESTEPPAIFGSDLQKLAYPDDYRKFVAGGSAIPDRAQHGDLIAKALEHPGEQALSVQLRGEYLYAAMGTGGFRIYDVSAVDEKDVSERVINAPVSALGQRFYVPTKYATDVATPTTLVLDPGRTQVKENEEQAIAPMYGFLYVTDREEGLIVVGDPKHGVGTLLDGNPRNNFLRRAVTFNPGDKMHGARRITVAGTFAYILCDAGLVTVNIADPLHPAITDVLQAGVKTPRGFQVQFRYGFLTDSDGLKVLDMTHLDHPRLIAGAAVPFHDARNVYVARTYAYVSAGAEGIGVVNVTQPEHPALTTMFNAEGKLNDVNDLKVGMVSSSQFAFVADGRNGMRVVQLFSPDSTREFYGFSPRPAPKLIATSKTPAPALAVSKGVDRDRAVDESGNQLSVFGRRGARPFNAAEMRKLFLHDGELYTVTDKPPGPPHDAAPALASR